MLLPFRRAATKLAAHPQTQLRLSEFAVHPIPAFTPPINTNREEFKPDHLNIHVTLDKADGMALLEQMVRIRRMEMAADALYKEKLIRGFCHLSIGQV